MSLLSRIPRRYKTALRARLHEARRSLAQTFLSYDGTRLVATLRLLGVRTGDSVMLHSAFGAHFGFRGTVDEFTDAVIDAVGAEGNLLMVSLPYRSSALAYLKTLKCFDVRTTPSMMGLVSEFFRRRPEVLRSLHPTHPVLAYGPKAQWLVAGHESCVHPCGPGTPFEKVASLDGQAVFFNVPFATFTFFHYLEHMVSPELPFPLYTDQPFLVPVIDRTGNPMTVTTFAFSLDAIHRRRFQVLERELVRRGLIRGRRVGNGRILAVRLRDAIECTRDMCRRGEYFYEFDDLRGPAPKRAGLDQRA